MIERPSKDDEDGDDGESEGPAPLVDSPGPDDDAEGKKDSRQDDTESDGESITDEMWMKMVQDTKQRSKPNPHTPQEGEWKAGLSRRARKRKKREDRHVIMKMGCGCPGQCNEMPTPPGLPGQ